MMTEHIVKVLQAYFITRDVKRFEVEKPAGYKFIPGQATDVSLNLPEWKNELRPFTFTSLNEWDYLEFTIKIYDGHQGVTNMLGKTNAGAELILHDVFGAIQYKGRGIFIAGGSGITPFIAIFRELYKSQTLQGNRLIYSNKTSEDVILDDELQKMLGQDFVKIFTDENTVGYIGRRIDRNYLIENISDFSQFFYLCGPDTFVTDISKLLLDLGATPQTIVVEK
jgi:ferredoxin-NADP reductase